MQSACIEDEHVPETYKLHIKGSRWQGKGGEGRAIVSEMMRGTLHSQQPSKARIQSNLKYGEHHARQSLE